LPTQRHSGSSPIAAVIIALALLAPIVDRTLRQRAGLSARPNAG
jgi:hypothetical protein